MLAVGEGIAVGSGVGGAALLRNWSRTFCVMQIQNHENGWIVSTYAPPDHGSAPIPRSCQVG
jgi:hypothetical protein